VSAHFADVLSVRVAAARALSILAWPALIANSIALTLWAMRSRAMDPELAAVIGGLISGAACLLLERVIPFEPAWRDARDDLRSDVGHALLGVALAPVLIRSAAMPLLVLASRALGAVTHNPAGLWPTRWPLAAQVALALLASELGGYAVHRAQHRWRWAWPVHAIHHDARRVYFFNGARLHAGDTAMTLVAAVFPLIILGATPAVLAVVSAIASAHIPLQHVNADLRFGPLEYIISAPTLHRWHHSRDPREGERNYGGLLIVWDLVFGTYFNPRDRRPPAEVGLYEGESVPSGFWQQVLWPLRRGARGA
jgi:sterol desaturase/sphingolipid hydroxylase (fatty acid hydroxylase superfamily)